MANDNGERQGAFIADLRGRGGSPEIRGGQQSGSVLPGTHSSLWAPDYRRAIPTAMQAEITLLLEVLGR